MQEKLKSYCSLNNSFTKSFVYHIGYNAGFFSEYNNMILAMVYCLENKLKFTLYSKDANFRIKDGWSDYFQLFCDEKKNPLHSIFNVRAERRFKSQILNSIFFLLAKSFSQTIPNQLLTFELWNKVRTLPANKIYSFKEINLNGNLREICYELVKMTWNYNSPTDIQIKELIQSLSLPEEYVGFHIRGGDKFIEAPLLEVNLYMEKASSLTTIKKAFVLTDDYTVIELLKQNYPDWEFFTLCKENERGYFHQNLKKESIDSKKEKFIKLFASMDILANSQIFIGTFSSNPGIYLGMRMEKEKIYSLDIPEWKI